jgi:proteasome accessory factor B
MPKLTSQIMVRMPLERMLHIHEAIKRGDYPNAPALAGELEVSSRTIKRDLDFMKYRLNLPLEYHRTRYGYYYQGKVEHFPSLPMSEAEMFALLVAQKAIAQYRGTPFQQPLETAFRRLTVQLDHHASYTLGGLDRAFSFRPFAPEDTDLDTFHVLTKGLREHRTVAFLYRNLGAREFRERRVHPYHLACIENQWYLFAFDTGRQAMRTFSLTRLRQARLTGEAFEPAPGFEVEEHLRGSFKVYKGSGNFEVVIEFDPWATDLVRGRQWHPTQQWTELPGGASRMRLRLGSLKEVAGWVLSWGTHATALQPPALIQHLQQTLAELQQRYAGGGSVEREERGT